MPNAVRQIKLQIFSECICYLFELCGLAFGDFMSADTKPNWWCVPFSFLVLSKYQGKPVRLFFLALPVTVLVSSAVYRHSRTIFMDYRLE